MSSLLDKRSTPAGKSEVDLFSLPPTQVAIERGYWTEVFLKHSLTDNGPFEFHIPPDPSYIDLSKNYIFMEVSIEVEAGALVAPINLLGKTIFKQVKLFLNNKACFDSGDSYAYICYLENELNNGNEAKTTHMEAAMYERDMVGELEGKESRSIKYRGSKFVNANRVQIMANLNCDLFSQERLLISHTDVRLELHRNSDAFCLLTWDEKPCALKLHKLSWFVRKVDLAPSLSLNIETYLSKETAKYPIRRMVCKTMNIDKGNRDTANLVLTNGQLPRRVIVTFVSKDSYFGNVQKNPFYFKPFNVREITLYAGGYAFPRNALQMNFKKSRYIHGYVNLLETLNIAQNDKGCITLREFADGYFFYAVDLTPDGSDNTFWELVSEGTCTVRVVFNEDLNEDIKMLCFCEFDNLVTIDKNRNVFLDYST